MRIKINDKIYRLKEIESGVDGLMELVEEPQFKDGDFVVNEAGSILIFRKKDGDFIYDHAFLGGGWLLFTSLVEPSLPGIKRYATEAEKQELLDALAKAGKRWNAEKLCVEDIPAELKKGDLAIFWDSDKGSAFIGEYDYFIGDIPFPHRDHRGDGWKNAIKFESTEQYIKLLKGEI
jgi:hypothetical protein